MMTKRSTATLALAAALLLELVNYFVIGYPAAGAHFAMSKGWFLAVAGQWYLLHLPGIFILNEFQFLRTYRILGAIVLFLCGWLDTALVLAACIWPAQMILRVCKRSIRPLRSEH